MDISSTCYCSRWARGGQRALILSAQICCTQVFSGEIARATLPSPTSDTAPRLLLQYSTASYQQNGSRIQKLRCAQAACEKWTKTWVGACSRSSSNGQACTRRGEWRVRLFFSYWVQFWAGIKICSCGQTLRNFMCLESAMHSYAALQCICSLSSKRNTTLKDNNYSRLFFLVIFIGAYLFTNSGYTADWRENRILQACFLISTIFCKGAVVTQRCLGEIPEQKQSVWLCHCTAPCGWNYSAEKQGKLPHQLYAAAAIPRLILQLHHHLLFR